MYKRKARAKAKKRRCRESQSTYQHGGQSVTSPERSDAQRAEASAQGERGVSALLLLSCGCCVMERLMCDVNLAEEAELRRLEGGPRWSDNLFDSSLLPSWMCESPELVSTTRLAASTSDVVNAMAYGPLRGRA